MSVTVVMMMASKKEKSPLSLPLAGIGLTISLSPASGMA
jgi:hypothetical protein